MYLDFVTYQNMGGTLVETTFDEYEFTAETIVDWYTFNRLKNETEYPTALPRLMFELIKMIQLKMDALSNNFTDEEGNVIAGAITQQSNDGVSIHFNSISSSDVVTNLNDKALGNMVRKYLSGLKNSLGRSLTYRGLYPGE